MAATRERMRDHRSLPRRLTLICAIAVASCALLRTARATELVSTATGLRTGTVRVSACQARSIDLDLVPVYDPAVKAYVVGSVLIEDLDTAPDACGMRDYSITLGGSSDAVLGVSQGVTPSTGDRLSVDLSAEHIRAASVTGIHLVIAGS
jgi:hypothetical protein